MDFVLPGVGVYYIYKLQVLSTVCFFRGGGGQKACTSVCHLKTWSILFFGPYCCFYWHLRPHEDFSITTLISRLEELVMNHAEYCLISNAWIFEKPVDGAAELSWTLLLVSGLKCLWTQKWTSAAFGNSSNVAPLQTLGGLKCITESTWGNMACCAHQRLNWSCTCLRQYSLRNQTSRATEQCHRCRPVCCVQSLHCCDCRFPRKLRYLTSALCGVCVCVMKPF